MSDIENLAGRFRLRRVPCIPAQRDSAETWRQRYLAEMARTLAVQEYLNTPEATVEGALELIQQRTANGD